MFFDIYSWDSTNLVKPQQQKHQKKPNKYFFKLK